MAVDVDDGCEVRVSFFINRKIQMKGVEAVGASVMLKNIRVLLGRSARDNRRQSSFTAVIGRA